MIVVPAGWRFDTRGATTRLRSADGALSLRYTERLRPVRRAVDLARECPLPDGFVPAEQSPPRRFLTDEGEPGALLSITGAAGDAPATVAMAFVVADDFYSRLVGFASGERAADIADTVATVARSDAHLLGHPRRRRYEYKRPPGYVGRARLLDAELFPREYPSNPSRIFVSAAVPRRPQLAKLIFEKMGGVLPTDSTLFTTRHGLEAESVRVQARGPSLIDTYLFCLEDASYLYVVRAEVPRGFAPTAAQELVQSIVPLSAGVLGASHESMMYLVE